MKKEIKLKTRFRIKNNGKKFNFRCVMYFGFGISSRRVQTQQENKTFLLKQKTN